MSYNLKLSPWTLTTDGCGAYRCRINRDGENDVSARVAFIEKTPRVRIRPDNEMYGINDCYNWAERPFKGDGPEDQESRDWCDSMLVLLGYEI